jgi:polysaccharide export outer membrane protein
MRTSKPESTSKVRQLWRVCCLLPLLAACTPGAGLPPAPPITRADAYHLGAGDQVRVITYGEEQLTNQFRVSDSGNLALPLLGTVHAAGMTTAELSQEIARDLQQRKLLRDPSVSVEVAAYRPVFVLGEVARPGEYPFQPGMTMLSAVADAGGFTYRGVQNRAYVVRQEPERAVEGILLPQDYVQPGDVIKIYERVF